MTDVQNEEKSAEQVDLSARTGKGGVKIGFLDKAGKPRTEARFAKWNVVWDTEKKKPYEQFIHEDDDCLRVYVQGPDRKPRPTQVVWRTLFPGWKPEWDKLSPEQAATKLEGMVCHQRTLKLHTPREVPNPNRSVALPEPLFGSKDRTLISDPLMLVASGFDLDVRDKSGKTHEEQLLFAHPRGRLQLEVTIGTDVIRHSIPIWTVVRVLNVELFILKNKKGEVYFDPTVEGSLDRDWFLQSMFNCTEIYASLGIDFNTFLPPGPGVESVSDRGRTYQFKFIDYPEKHYYFHPDDDPASVPSEANETARRVLQDRGSYKFRSDAGQAITDYEMWYLYPRAYPSPSRNYDHSVRVFFATEQALEENKGVATPEYLGKLVSNPDGISTGRGLSRGPAARTCWVLHGRKSPAPKVPSSPQALEEHFHADLYTTAHEVGHILGPRTATHGDGHFSSLANNFIVHLLSEGGTTGTTDWERAYHGTCRVCKEGVTYDWPSEMQKRTFLSPPLTGSTQKKDGGAD